MTEFDDMDPALVALGSLGLIVSAMIGKDALYAVYAITVMLGRQRR